MGTSSIARAWLAQAMAWCIQSSDVMAILYGSGVEESDQCSGGDDQAQNQQAERFADRFALHRREIPAADGAEGREVGENETDAGHRMRLEVFGFDCGESNQHHKERQCRGAMADLQNDVEPGERFSGRQFLAGCGCGGGIVENGFHEIQGTGTTEVTSGTRSRRLRSMPIWSVMVLDGQPWHAP